MGEPPGDPDEVQEIGKRLLGREDDEPPYEISVDESNEPAERGAPCAQCGEFWPADGQEAGICAGRFLCHSCAAEYVVYVGECLDCGWEFECRDRESNWFHARTRVQQEGNNHETRVAFDDETHETVWRVVDGGEE